MQCSYIKDEFSPDYSVIIPMPNFSPLSSLLNISFNKIRNLKITNSDNRLKPKNQIHLD